ncbi:glycoside hydrolase family 32 protein [Gracilibacillus salitolerans]|uniref:Glycoside hydrolase family 32 protein n=1 Tax=Gracilibacillus salitolerans TaxID=2663022 RepID=A0A5Q2TTC5_9BACI|nr:glycoside hydrolase family 32 protein [Gracilibacillus salitolerans]QGH36910.1 glycoside hydrolase family 32 protein [Gracilibacillus salitolerans]
MLFSLFSLLLIILIFFSLHTVNKKPTSNSQDEDYSYRADYHFTVPDNWKNDPQRPLYFNEKYHYYYLYNRDYPEGNGTEWRHATSKDLIYWEDEGIAVPKYTNENGDPWSGSVIVDHDNTAGFGENTLVAIVTQPSANGQQEQYLWYSTDDGLTFNEYQNEPVMPNPGIENFRDPKIIWEEESQKWVLLMAEGSKIGFYESENLKEWQYTNGFQTENLGILECPDLFQLQTDDGSIKWVMGVSANGMEQGKPNTYAYWIGDFNGQTFTPDHKEPKWLDYGFDWYGGVTFEDGESRDKLNNRYALAWMNNWAYANNTPTLEEGFNGQDSIVRKIELKKDEQDEYYLTSQPKKELDQLIESTESYPEVEVDGMVTLETVGDAYQLETDISWDEAENIGIRLRESNDQNRHIDIGFFPRKAYSYVNRESTDQPNDNNNMVESKAPMDQHKKNAHLKILVDKTSVEVFIDEGKITHSNLVFPLKEDQGITLFSEGGKAIFENVEIQHMHSIHE